jgi:hypothetical protein
MKAFGHTELTTTELPDALEFRAVYHGSLRDLGDLYLSQLVSALPVIGFLLLFSILKKDSVRATAVGGVVGILAGSILALLIGRMALWLRGPETVLSITSSGWVATGRLGRNFLLKSATAPWLRAKAIGWESMGLTIVAKEFWRLNTCVLPGLNEDQAKAVRSAIMKRFPEILYQIYPETGEPNKRPASFLFGDRISFTTLGIGGSQPESAELRERSGLPTVTP